MAALSALMSTPGLAPLAMVVVLVGVMLSWAHCATTSSAAFESLPDEDDEAHVRGKHADASGALQVPQVSDSAPSLTPAPALPPRPPVIQVEQGDMSRRPGMSPALTPENLARYRRAKEEEAKAAAEREAREREAREREAREREEARASRASEVRLFGTERRVVTGATASERVSSAENKAGGSQDAVESPATAPSAAESSLDEKSSTWTPPLLSPRASVQFLMDVEKMRAAREASVFASSPDHSSNGSEEDEEEDEGEDEGEDEFGEDVFEGGGGLDEDVESVARPAPAVESTPAPRRSSLASFKAIGRSLSFGSSRARAERAAKRTPKTGGFDARASLRGDASLSPACTTPVAAEAEASVSNFAPPYLSNTGDAPRSPLNVEEAHEAHEAQYVDPAELQRYISGARRGSLAELL